MPSDQEERLEGGNAAGLVVRIGDTVRKPFLSTTPATVEFVLDLQDAGLDLPEPRGRDAVGRQIWEYVPGRLMQDDMPTDSVALQRVGRMIRRIHDASPRAGRADDSEVLIPTAGADLICHNDLAPWNLIVGESDRWVFIDWDGAGPSTRLWDLAYAAQSFALLNAEQDPATAARRLRALIDGYDADASMRSELPQAMVDRTRAMFALLRDSHATGREPWGSMFTSGHGAYWRATASFIERNVDVWRDALLGE
nr:phosphotransferase [uncultured Microbacterium sp.]